MTEKNLKKLSRAELLEMLLIQTQEVERLQIELSDVQQQLEQRKLHLEKAGNIADAALALSGVFDAAQAAASRYLENIELMEQQTRENCRIMEEKTHENCRIMEQQTRDECEKMIQEARKNAEKFWNEIQNEIRDPYIEHERWMEIHAALTGITYEKLEF